MHQLSRRPIYDLYPCQPNPLSVVNRFLARAMRKYHSNLLLVSFPVLLFPPLRDPKGPLPIVNH